ncbi:MAG TPA: hypothetical protein PK400_04260 [Phycisphaerales bacterium]|nr:hypothetical protein [Phycisphaerales bacterium]HRQ74711.1 hypothetical protein [Phycisphaerales bacterium]
MNNLDDRIRRALHAEDKDLLKDLKEPGMLARTLTAMQRAPRWTVVYAFLISLALIGAAVWFAVRFFSATETREMIAWATGFLFVMLAIAAIKGWFWMQMEKYVLLREIKRLELQVARLVERLDK